MKYENPTFKWSTAISFGNLGQSDEYEVSFSGIVSLKGELTFLWRGIFLFANHTNGPQGSLVV